MAYLCSFRPSSTKLQLYSTLRMPQNVAPSVNTWLAEGAAELVNITAKSWITAAPTMSGTYAQKLPHPKRRSCFPPHTIYCWICSVLGRSEADDAGGWESEGWVGV